MMYVPILKYCSSPKKSLFVSKTSLDTLRAGFSTPFTEDEKHGVESTIAASTGDPIYGFAPSQDGPRTFDKLPFQPELAESRQMLISEVARQVRCGWKIE